MSILSLPLVGQLYLPLLFTSLIIGVIILILLEKRNLKQECDRISSTCKSAKKVTEYVKPNGNTLQDVNTSESKENKDKVNVADNSNVVSSFQTLTKVENDYTRSTSCSSSSEGETPRLAGKVRQAKKRHRCGSDKVVKICSQKKAVSAITILSNTEDEHIKNNLEGFAAQFKTGGLTCTIRPVQGKDQFLIKKDVSHLHLFVVTSNSWDDLHKHFDPEFSEGNPAFLYSVVYLDGTNTSDIRVSGENLSAVLCESGGTEWLPLTYITPSENSHAFSSLTSQEYITKFFKKVAKQSKKCCGTTCSSKKAVDIEDLVTSLLPEVMPVNS